ncbi:hypothetical protein ESA94_13875 [Lacibacter luteus]|uniref:Uncharacterized protein n=1 Tax=Lacibacter luteus TaxID=2508719 RepID=A0A4Q1CGG0_9BACT|nr:hypothetical protein [Lacibacter luteus]RXK59225.1 hypothetical protein ESA94_13875 [Lacibacter luteus]
MKTNIVLSFFICVVALTGCKKLGVNFSIANQTNFRVESSSPINLPFEMGTPDVTTNSSQQFGNNNTAANLIKEIKLEELKLSITSPTSKTFSFLKSVEVYISTNSSNEILLASLDNIASTSQSISLTTTTQDLARYVKASSYKLRTRVITKETLTQAVDIRADIKFKVKAGLL